MKECFGEKKRYAWICMWLITCHSLLLNFLLSRKKKEAVYKSESSIGPPKGTEKEGKWLKRKSLGIEWAQARSSYCGWLTLGTGERACCRAEGGRQNLEGGHLKVICDHVKYGRRKWYILKILCEHTVCKVGKRMQLASSLKEVAIEHCDVLDIWWKYMLQLSGF